MKAESIELNAESGGQKSDGLDESVVFLCNPLTTPSGRNKVGVILLVISTQKQSQLPSLITNLTSPLSALRRLLGLISLWII